MSKGAFTFFLLSLLFSPFLGTSAFGATAPMVVLIIGDGMGFEQVRAGRAYLGEPLAFESMPVQGELTTYSADNSVTDSAAAGTALATGSKVNNGVISMALPGDGSDLQTLLEYFKDRGYLTGLVTTTYMSHATPAAFGAHAANRSLEDDIAGDYLNRSRPNVLFGGGGNGLSLNAASAAGYAVVTNRQQLLTVSPLRTWLISGQFASTHLPYEYDGLGDLPHLHDMAEHALSLLDRPEVHGVFLMIEGGKIDHAAHNNDLARLTAEVLELSRTVAAVRQWASGRSNTLLIVTADHETGGLQLVQDNGPGQYPSVTWTGGSHTGSNVPLWAEGYGARLFQGILNNTDVPQLIRTATAGLGLDQLLSLPDLTAQPPPPRLRIRRRRVRVILPAYQGTVYKLTLRNDGAGSRTRLQRIVNRITLRLNPGNWSIHYSLALVQTPGSTGPNSRRKRFAIL